MQVTTYISVDLVSAHIAPVVYAKQYDSNTRYITVSLLENGVPYTVPEEVFPVFQMGKPDGKFVYYDVDENDEPAVVVSGSEVTVRLVPAALQAAGVGHAQVGLYNENGDHLSSFSFDVHIQRSAVPEGAVSESYLHILSEVIRDVYAARDAAEDFYGSAQLEAVRAEEAADRAERAAAQAAAKFNKEGIVELVYPVGALFYTTNPLFNNPTTLAQQFGGVWADRGMSTDVSDARIWERVPFEFNTLSEFGTDTLDALAAYTLYEMSTGDF